MLWFSVFDNNKFMFTLFVTELSCQPKRLSIAEKCAVITAYDTTGAGHMTIKELDKRLTKEGPPAKRCNTRTPVKFLEIEQPLLDWFANQRAAKKEICASCQENGV